MLIILLLSFFVVSVVLGVRLLQIPWNKENKQSVANGVGLLIIFIVLTILTCEGITATINYTHEQYNVIEEYELIGISGDEVYFYSDDETIEIIQINKITYDKDEVSRVEKCELFTKNKLGILGFILVFNVGQNKEIVYRVYINTLDYL